LVRSTARHANALDIKAIQSLKSDVLLTVHVPIRPKSTHVKGDEMKKNKYFQINLMYSPHLSASRNWRGSQPRLSLQQLDRQREGHHHHQHRNVEGHQRPKDPEETVVNHAQFWRRHDVGSVYETWQKITWYK
jgi:hypothetical protein